MVNLIPKDAQKILSSQQIEQKINRMALEILELHYNRTEIVLLGIENGGYQLASLLLKRIKSIQNIHIEIASIYVNKETPYSEASRINEEQQNLNNKAIILIDDVGNSGSTLFHALQTIYPLHPISIHVAVLIDRTHKRFPIKADIVGMDLATTLTEHIRVVFDDNGAPEGAYIF
ncbi:MAG: hypothetical protein M9958_03700 [Chitinophagales bacterium]|nr:hypothetical protein [Chitinophagales bacterium]